MKIFFKYVLFMRVHFVSVHVHTQTHIIFINTGTSLLRSPTELGKSHRNGEVTILQGPNVLFFAIWNIVWDWARVTVMMRFHCMSIDNIIIYVYL